MSALDHRSAKDHLQPHREVAIGLLASGALAVAVGDELVGRVLRRRLTPEQYGFEAVRPGGRVLARTFTLPREAALALLSQARRESTQD